MLPGVVVNETLKQTYYEKGYWTSKTVFNHFVEAVQRNPKQIAVVDKWQRLSYEALYERVLLLAAGLQQIGVKKGDFVSAQLPNWAENSMIYLACTRIGAVFNPIPATARFQEVRYIVGLVESKVLFIPDFFRGFDYIDMIVQVKREVDIPNVVVVNSSSARAKEDHSFPLFSELLYLKQADELILEEEVSSDDPLVVLFTSGTESQPKGVVHSHNTVLFTVKSMIQTLSITDQDAIFMASPLSHATGFLYAGNLPIVVGGKSVLMEHFSGKEALKIIADEKCTFTMGSTPFLHDLLMEVSEFTKNHDISHFRFFLCGGAPVPRQLVTEAIKIGFKVLGVYGASESAPHTISQLDDSEESIVSYDGKPVAGIEVKIVNENYETLPLGEVGEEASRGPNVFLGYFKRPDLTEKYLDQDGWYYSGDLCVLHPNDYIRVVGRKKDIIIRGGQNISPTEIEDILFKHPKIHNVAIIGIPDERMGEKAMALVIPNEGEEFTFDEMIEFLSQQNIAKYKYPEKLQIVDELPRTPSGKIQKFKLREQFVGTI